MPETATPTPEQQADILKQQEEIRAQLISLCEQALVHESKWDMKDWPEMTIQAGELWALLKSGCAFRIVTEQTATIEERTEGNISDAKTFYISVTFLTPEGAAIPPTPENKEARAKMVHCSMYALPTPANMLTHPAYQK